MHSANTRTSIPLSQPNKYIAIALILGILAVVGFSTYLAFKSAPSQSPPQAVETVVTQQILAEQYGLGVNLIAVTAAGGMVDLRLRIIDGVKAQALLEDQANFPALRAGNGVILQTSEDIASQPIKFEDGSNIFVLYPNNQNAVKPGDPVNIIFGDLQVEATQTR